MADKLFTNNVQCTLSQELTLKCKAVNRIKIILNEFDDTNFMDKFTLIFMKNNYTNTSLLNDFHHIKYMHHADDNHCAFANIFEYITDGIRTDCNGKKCQFIVRHYRDRSKLQNNYVLTNGIRDTDTDHDQYNPFDGQCMMDLISRIHVYFIHSYHLNRFTLQESRVIEEQMEVDNASNQGSFNRYEVKSQLLTDMMNQKKHNMIEFGINNGKFYEHITPNQKSVLDWTRIHTMLKKHNIVIAMDHVRSALGVYTNTDDLIADLIDACYAQNDESLPLPNSISIHCSNMNHTQKQTLYKLILFGYFEKQAINNTNFIKMAENLLRKHYPCIDIAEFRQVASNANISGCIFVKETPEYKNSLKFAKIFKRIKGYKKTDLTNIYVKIHSAWDGTELDIKDEIEDEIEDANHDPDSNSSIQHNAPKDIYEIGTQFYYWTSLRHQPRYIAPKYSNLKTEMMDNTVRSLDISQWKSLQTECKAYLDTDAARDITSNGFWYNHYQIQEDMPFSIQHVCVLKLYTDFTTDSKIFCTILRSANPKRIVEIATWCRLLSECVHCYGTLSHRKTPYYRGINSTFLFESIITRLNLPMSTSRDLLQAVHFTEENGLVLSLCKYGKSDLFKFDCDTLSAFSYEKETVFFGGGPAGTMFQILSIRQHIGKWISYKKYMQPLNMILRLIHGQDHGFSVKKENDMRNKANETIAYELLEHLFYCHSDSQMCALELPLYVDTLLKYYASTPTIVFNVSQLISDHQWIHPLFIKPDTRKILLNVERIMTIFNTSDEIVFVVPNQYILSTDECISLIQNDFASTMNSNVTIRFKWLTEMPILNRVRITMDYHQYLTAINWCVRFAKDCMSFQKVQRENSRSRAYLNCNGVQTGDQTLSLFEDHHKEEVLCNTYNRCVSEMDTKRGYIGKKEDNLWWQYHESKTDDDDQMDDERVYQELIQNAGVFRWQCPHGFASGEHQGLMHLKPKYKNAKEEALHNTYNQLSVDSWNQTIRKSEQFNRSFARRRIKTKSKGKFEDQIVGVCSQWRQGDDIDLGEIVTLKLYTDFDKLQFQLKKCLRFDSNTDERAALENRLREFFHWRHNLLTVLSKFGSTLTEKKLLYHGVNAKMILYNGRRTRSTFYGPLSTSSSYHVARTFATMKGMVLCVATQYQRLGMCRAFNASLLSDYPEEQEWLIGFIYMRVLQVITRPLHRSWNTFKDMDGMDAFGDEIPLSSKVRSIFFAVGLFVQQVFAMDVHSEYWLCSFLYVQCKYDEDKDNRDNGRIQRTTFMKKLEKEFVHEQRDKEVRTKEQEQYHRILGIAWRKFEEFRFCPSEEQLIKIDQISDNLKPYFMDYVGADIHKHDKYMISFDKICRIFVNVREIHFINAYTFNDFNVVLARFIAYIDTKECKLRKIKFIFNDEYDKQFSLLDIKQYWLDKLEQREWGIQKKDKEEAGIGYQIQLVLLEWKAFPSSGPSIHMID